MNYKKLKRVFALGMAVLLSVSTSVYGGTMEVHAAEAISDDLLENEVIDNSSLEENTENKGDDQDDAKDAEPAIARIMPRMQDRTIARTTPRMQDRAIAMTTSRMQNREMCRAIPMAMFRM